MKPNEPPGESRRGSFPCPLPACPSPPRCFSRSIRFGVHTAYAEPNFTPLVFAVEARADSFLLIPGDRMSPLRLTNFSNGDFPIGWLEVPAIG